MFDPKHLSRDKLSNYVAARVTDAEEAWLRAEMQRRGVTMTDLIRLALGQLRSRRGGHRDLDKASASMQPEVMHRP